jgi:thioredoxin 1
LFFFVFFTKKAANSAKSVSSTSGVVKEVTTKDELLSILSSGNLTVVDYWAPWCKNCKKISPTIEKLAAELSNVTFVKINTVEAEELAVENKVDALPTLQFFKGSSKIGEYKGSVETAIEAAIRSYA